MTTNTSTHRAARTPCRLLIAWMIGCSSMLLLLLGTGVDHPGTPPLTDPSSWRVWWTSHDPVDAAAGVARVAAIVLVLYLLTVTVVQLLLGCLTTARAGEPGHIGRVARIARGLGPRFLSGLTAAAVLSVAPGVAGATAAIDKPRTESPATPGAGATMEVVVDTPASTATTVVATAQMSAGAAHTSLPWALPPPVPTVQSPPVDLPPVQNPALVASSTEAPIPFEVEIRPGDHLWSIAEAEVSRRLGRPASPDEIDPYWRQLIETNRDRLAQPDNPDLIYPGQSLVLP